MKERRDLKGAAARTQQKQSGGLFLVPRAGGGDALDPAGRIPPLRPQKSLENP